MKGVTAEMKTECGIGGGSALAAALGMHACKSVSQSFADTKRNAIFLRTR